MKHHYVTYRWMFAWRKPVAGWGCREAARPSPGLVSREAPPCMRILKIETTAVNHSEKLKHQSNVYTEWWKRMRKWRRFVMYSQNTQHAMHIGWWQWQINCYIFCIRFSFIVSTPFRSDRFTRTGIWGPACNDFGYNENHLTSSSFFSIFWLVVSGTQRRVSLHWRENRHFQMRI